MSSYPTMANSSGTRTPWRTISWSTPSASRSLAHTPAVGRRDAGRPMTRAAASRPPATLSSPGDRTVSSASGTSRTADSTPAWRSRICGRAACPPTKVIRRWPRPSRCPAPSRPPPRGAPRILGGGGSPPEEGDRAWRAFERVRGDRPPAEDVVGRDGALVWARRAAVDEDDRDAAVAECVQLWGQLGGRGDEDAVHPLLGEQAQVRGLLLRAVVGVAQDHREAGRVDDVLDPAGDVGEEGVGDVEHHQADGATGTRPQLTSQLVADEAEGGDRVEDLGPGGRADHVGPVEDVAHRADRHPGPAGDVPDAGGQDPSSWAVAARDGNAPGSCQTLRPATAPVPAEGARPAAVRSPALVKARASRARAALSVHRLRQMARSFDRVRCTTSEENDSNVTMPS